MEKKNLLPFHVGSKIKVKHIVQFSGGAASAYVGYLVVKKYGRKNVILLHQDTKAECDDTQRFLKQVSDHIGVPIKDKSDGRDLFQVIEDENCIPNAKFAPFCTRILKQEPAEKFLKKLNCPYILYSGHGAEEWGRVQKATARAESLGRKLRCLLYEEQIPNEEVKRIIREDWKICLPDAYKYLSHNNCIPCFKAGKSHFRKVLKYYPEKFAKAKRLEEIIGHTVFKDMSLAELEYRWSAGSMDDLFGEDTGVPCMCSEF